MDTEDSGNASGRRGGGAVRTVLAVFSLLGILTLVLLYPLPPLNRAGRAILDLGHAPAFAVVTIMLYRLVRAVRPATGWRTLMLIALMMIVFGCVSEVLQSKTGRGYSFQDAMADALGVVAGVCWSVRSHLTRLGIRTLLGFVSLVALCIPSATPLMIFVDIVRQKAEMPVLASFEHGVELTRWLAYEGKILRTHRGVTDGAWALRADLSPGRYPGVTMVWPASDWSAYEELVFDLTVPTPGETDAAAGALSTATDRPEPLTLILKIEDADHNGEYEDRFHRTLVLTPGTHEVRVSLAEVELAPQDRTLDLRDVSRLQLYLHNSKQAQTFYLDHLRLE